MKTLTNNYNIIKVYNYPDLIDTDKNKIRDDFENCKLPVIENFVTDDIIKFIKENVNVDTNPIQCTEKGYDKWKKKFKKIDDYNNFFKLLKSTNCKNDILKMFNDLEIKIIDFINNFLGYKIVHINRIIRFTETINENLHFDIFEPTDPKYGFLRVFINLDSEKRTWNNSLNIYEYIKLKEKEILDLLNNKIIKTITYSGKNRINNIISKHINKSGFGSEVDNIFNDSMPKIQTHFPPGSIWICDSIKNSHQIIYGKKCISYNFIIKKESFNSKDNLYYNKITPILNDILNKIKL